MILPLRGKFTKLELRLIKKRRVAGVEALRSPRTCDDRTMQSENTLVIHEKTEIMKLPIHILSVLVGMVMIAQAAEPVSVADRSRKDKSPAEARKPKPFEPTSLYEERSIEGWTIVLNKNFAKEHPDLCRRTLKLLRFQLYQIPRKVPAEAVKKLRKVHIWVELAEPHHPCMAYHPGVGWLKDHDMNPDKVKCVELANAENFLEWTKAQPWMVLHELAHAYHHQFLKDGFDNAELLAAFQGVKAEKNYESVLRINGRNDRAYALTNQMEYFAETSEAYFGTNDFYPYVRSELKEHDPRMFELLGKLWGEKPKKRRSSNGR